MKDYLTREAPTSSLLSAITDPIHYMEAKVAALIKFRVDIEKALLYGGGSHTYDDFCKKVLFGTAHMYLYENSMIIMELDVHPQFRTYSGWIAVGDLEEILAAEEELMNAARHLECKHMTLTGRAGWEKPLKAQGWSFSLLTMGKEITYG